MQAPLKQGCTVLYILYHKILIISPGLIFVQKAFFNGLVFRGSYYWREF